MKLRRRLTHLAAIAGLLVSSCGGGGGGGNTSTGGGGTTTPPATAVYAVPAQEALTTGEVQQVLAQAVAEAKARSKPATIAVVDRTGNVLAVYQMAGANPKLTVKTNDRNVPPQDIEGLSLPDTLIDRFHVLADTPANRAANAAATGAIAKAVTGAYLSSAANAFSTRTASFIVQQNFPAAPSTVGLESGPLFGVQFSQLPCSDLSARFTGTSAAGAMIGPKRSPLGLSADAGGLPLYKNGVVVGGVGVMADGNYSFDPNVLDVDNDDEEFIALAGETGFEPADTIKADRISIDGTTLRFTDATAAGLKSSPAGAPAFSSLGADSGGLIPITGYFAGTVIAGTPYGSEASGIRKSTTAEFDNPDAFVLSNGSGTDRYPIRGGTDAGDVATPLSATEARALLEEAFKVMSHTRGAIRQPASQRAQMSISLVDTRGSILGLVRAPDAPLFGIDVSLQKARSAAFFSGPHAASDLQGTTLPAAFTAISPPLADNQADVRAFPGRVRDFVNDQSFLTGKFAISDRWEGLLSRPYFPDGEVGKANGPFSRPFANWSIFNTGLQTALILPNIGVHLTYLFNSTKSFGDTDRRCTFLPDATAGQNRLQNGIQIFPGGFPIYRGNTLVGAIGVSGDGIDQDDLVSFLATYNAGQRVGGIGPAATAIRADTIAFPQAGGAHVNYVQCPFAPYVDTNDQNVCDGK